MHLRASSRRWSIRWSGGRGPSRFGDCAHVFVARVRVQHCRDRASVVGQCVEEALDQWCKGRAFESKRRRPPPSGRPQAHKEALGSNPCLTRIGYHQEFVSEPRVLAVELGDSRIAAGEKPEFDVGWLGGQPVSTAPAQLAALVIDHGESGRRREVGGAHKLTGRGAGGGGTYEVGTAGM